MFSTPIANLLVNYINNTEAISPVTGVASRENQPYWAVTGVTGYSP